MSILASEPRRRRRAGKIRFRSAPLEPCSDDWLSLDRLLEPDHLARTILRAVNRLDVTSLWDLYAGFGSAAYPPQLLLAGILFETQRGHHRPAQWYRHAKEPGPLRWLLRGLVPSRACWYQFRSRIGPKLLDLVHQTVRQAIVEGFTSANRAAIDGTLLAANASRHKLLNQDTLKQRCEQLQQAVVADKAVAAEPTLIQAVPVTDPAPATPKTAPTPQPAGTAEETATSPVPPRWLAPTVRGRQQQASRYLKAKEEMARRQARNRQKRASKRTPAERIVLSTSDPETAVTRDKEKVFRPLYNVQLLDDLDSPLILGWLVVAQPSDSGLLGRVLQQANEGLGVTIQKVLGDAAYAAGADLARAKELNATVYAPWQSNDYSNKKEKKYYPKEKFTWQAEKGAYECPQGQRLSYQGSSQQQRTGTEKIELHLYRAEKETCAACPARSKCTPGKGARTISRNEHEEILDELRQRMQTEEAKQLYKLRKQTVELANADMKEHRGLRRLSGRGLKSAHGQVGLIVLAHDLVALHGLHRKRQQGTKATTPCPTTA